MATVSSLQIPLGEVAKCLFVSNFILMPQKECSIGHLDFILPLLEREDTDSHIHHAFKACSMAFLHNRGGAAVKVWDTALQEYSMALARTNAALRDARQQQTDATLSAVILLGMFEVRKDTTNQTE